MSESFKKKYDEEAMCKALEAVRSGTPINTAARKYRVPRSTLYGKYKNLHASNRRGRPTVLSSKEENKIVQWIIDMSRLGCPITKEHLINSVTLQINNSNIANKFIHGQPSRHWYQGLRKRHPILIKRISENITLSRASVSEDSVRKWFEDTEDYLRKENLLNVDSNSIYNIGETPLILNPIEGPILEKNESKNVHNVANNEEQNLTVLITGNARGQLAPTLLVFNCKRVPSSIYAKLPEGFYVSTSKEGSMTASLFYDYIANKFWPWLIKNKIQMPVILFLGSHVSHLTQLLSEFCRAHQIVLIALPPNTLHFLQPMDVSMFKPLKAHWMEKLKHYCDERENLKSVSKEDIAPILETIFREMNLEEILSNSFRTCGLDPLSVNEINFTKVFKRKNTNDCQPTVNTTCSQPCLLELVEKYIDETTLRTFKCEKSEEWTGREEDKNLFCLWRRILNDNVQSRDMSDSDNTPVELVLLPDVFDSQPDQDECIIGF